MADRWAIEQCKAFFHLTDEDELKIAGNHGNGYLLCLWDELSEAMYEEPLSLLRQEWWHAYKGPEKPPPVGFWRTLADDAVLLDYGCGTAELERKWTRPQRWHSQVFVDASKICRGYLRKKYGDVPIVSPEEFWQKADAARMDGFPPTTWLDAIVCTDVFEHVPDPLPLLWGLWGVLKPGGQMLTNFSCSYPHAGHLKASIDKQPIWWDFLTQHAQIISEDYYIWAIKTADNGGPS